MSRRPAWSAVGGLAVALCVALAGGPAVGQGGLSALQESDEPLEINADEGIEWQRDRQVYIARGNARAAQGELEVFGDVLTAYYRDAAEGGTEIYRVDAEGNVKIVSPSESVYGDSATYDIDSGVFTLLGEDLRMVTELDEITAEDSLEYHERERVAVARGNAVAVREDKRVRGDILTAYFQEDAEGNLEIERVHGTGDVEIATPTEFARGDKAIYYVNREFATLTGTVKVTRGENQLNGEYAEVNLKTGVSKLLGAPAGQSGDTRVRGLVVPRRKPEGDS